MWIFFTIVTAMAMSDLVSAQSCLPEWTMIATSGTDILCVKVFVDERATWDGARVVCKGHGGDLFMPTTRDLTDKAHRQTLLASEKTVFYWIGVADPDEDGTFTYLNGDNVGSEAAWRRREPNNAHGNEHCVEMKGGVWYDKQCCKKRNFICQAKPGPEIMSVRRMAPMSKTFAKIGGR